MITDINIMNKFWCRLPKPKAVDPGGPTSTMGNAANFTSLALVAVSGSLRLMYFSLV